MSRMLCSWPCNYSTTVSDLAAWLLSAHWRQTWTWICNQKPPVPELKCCLEVEWWLLRHVCYGTLLHLDSCAWGLSCSNTADGWDAAGASFPTCSYYMTILFQSTHTQWHCGFTAGKRRKLLYKQGYSWLCSPVCLQGSPCMPMSPKQSGNQLHTVVLLTLSKAAFPPGCACPNSLSPGDLSQDNSLHYFSYFSWLPASNTLPAANLLSSAFATHSIRLGFSSWYSLMPCIT